MPLASERDLSKAQNAFQLLRDDAYKDSLDLQLYLTILRLSSDVAQTFYDAKLQPRQQALTTVEQEQSLSRLMYLGMRYFQTGFKFFSLDPRTEAGLRAAASSSHFKSSPELSLLASTAIAALDTMLKYHKTAEELRSLLRQANSMLGNWAAKEPVAAALERQQQSRGFSPVAKAADVRLVWLYIQQEMAPKCCNDLDTALDIALAANSKLQELDPEFLGNQLMMRGMLLQRWPEHASAALAAYRSSIREAVRTKSHALEAVTCDLLASALVEGVGGPFCSVEEVDGLFDQAKAALTACKPWLPGIVHTAQYDMNKRQRRQFAEIKARHPGQSMVPTGATPVDRDPAAAGVACSGCGKMFSSLNKHCSACHAVAYCSRACQVRHWKEGGHKQECARMAARAGRSSAST